MKSVIIVKFYHHKKGKTQRFCDIFKKGLKGVKIVELDLTKSHSDIDIRKAFLSCTGVFFCTPPIWFNVPQQIKRLIEALDKIDNKLWVRERILALAVNSPQGGELGVFTSIVAPLTIMGFSLVGGGYAYHRGNAFDEHWAWAEVRKMAETFTKKLSDI